jgi:hypothetical protein
MISQWLGSIRQKPFYRGILICEQSAIAICFAQQRAQVDHPHVALTLGPYGMSGFARDPRCKLYSVGRVYDISKDVLEPDFGRRTGA